MSPVDAARSMVEYHFNEWKTDPETRAVVLSKRRMRNITAIRRKLAIRLRQAGFSFPVIGAALGRNHSTIITLIGDKVDGIKEAKLPREDRNSGREGDDIQRETLCEIFCEVG